MLGSQIDIAFYMVISLLEAFQNSLGNDQKQGPYNRKSAQKNNQTQNIDNNHYEGLSVRSQGMKSAGIRSIRGLQSEKSVRQSDTYSNKFSRNNYDQTIYKNNASEQGEQAEVNLSR